MDGTAEIERLAELLRIGAGVGRKIADVRPVDADELRGLAEEAERMAGQLEAMAKRASPDGTPEPHPDDTLQ